MMKTRAYQGFLTGAIVVFLTSPVLADNLLSNPGFEAFVGPFTPNHPVNTSNLNRWQSSEGFQSVVGATVIPPFPFGWSGNNFAQQSQALTPTADEVDDTDQIKQGIDGNVIVPGSNVRVSFKYINGGNGARPGKLEVYGMDPGQSWSQLAPWNCDDDATHTHPCALLYSADLPAAHEWTKFQGSFSPQSSYAVVAVGITLGGPNAWTAIQNGARGVDKVSLSQNTPPNCSAATPSTNTLWPPNHAYVPIKILGVTDPDPDRVMISINSIFQDEPVLGPGSGHTSPDAKGLGTKIARVRAERAGGANGRVYHIDFTASDRHDGSCTGEVRVNVPKSQGRNGAAVDDGALFDSTVP